MDWTDIIYKVSMGLLVMLLVVLFATLFVSPSKVEDKDIKILRKLQELQSQQTLNSVLIIGNMNLNK